MNKAKIALAIALCFATALIFSCAKGQKEMCESQKPELTRLQQAKIGELIAEKIVLSDSDENNILGNEEWIDDFTEAYKAQ